jgi:hypothetical protein
MKQLKDILEGIPTFQPSIMKTIALEHNEVIKYFQAIAEKVSPGFVIDKDNETVINNLIDYFTGHQGALDISKGIFLHGTIGCGKSILMKIFKLLTGHVFQVNSFRHIEACEIENKYLKCGDYALEDYLKGTWLIDDLGFEKGQVNYYGTRIELLSEILTKRYNVWQAGSFTHITTNLTATKIEERYGQRVRSRFTEMINDVYLPGPDRRK